METPKGFLGFTKVYDSDAHIFHYGHVRDKEKKQAKQELLLKMIRPVEKLKKYQKREQKDFQKTETLSYYGPHPQVMREENPALWGRVFLYPQKRRFLYF